MAGVCRAFIDTAGGVILVGDERVLVDGQPVCVEGNPVANHGISPHNNAVMMNGDSRVLVGGIPVCTENSQASCGHVPTGSSRVIIG